jgi:capsular polysaccharide biosynthesis protein
MEERHDIDYAHALRRGWWLILLLIGVAIATAGVVTSRQHVVYESSAMLVVTPSSETSNPSDVMKSLETLERRTVIATFARVPGTLESKEAIAVRLGLDARVIGPYRIHGSVVPNTNILRIDVDGPDAKRVAAVANAAAELTKSEARNLYRVYSMRLLARATPSHRPSFPDPRRNYLAGAAIGTFLGVAAALAAGRDRSRE